MKRRDFLVASAGLAGASFTGVGEAKSCPPPTVLPSPGQVAATICPSRPVTAPTWWNNLAEGTWAVIANTTGKRLTDVVPVPNPIVPGLGGAVTDLAQDWCSAAVDQAAGEYMFVSHGGHSSWAGNEAYSLAVRDETPGWRRLTDPTPVAGGTQWVPTGTDTRTWPTQFLGRWLDGRPTATHCSGEIYANGRVWFPWCNSFSNGAGDSYNMYYSFNLNFGPLVAARAANTPLAWTSANIGPWEIWGQLAGANGNTMTFGVSVYDPMTGKIWYLGGKGEVDVYAASIDTFNVSASSPPAYKVWHWQPSFPTGEFQTWAFVAHDLRLLVAADGYRRHIALMNLDNPDAGWTKVTNVTGDGWYGQLPGGSGADFSSAGAVYIAQNNCGAIGEPVRIGRTIYKLQIPVKLVNGNKVYDPAGTWAWTTINGGGTGPDGVYGNNTYRRWNSIDDMGDGRTAIIVCSDVNAVHVYKVPSGGI